MRPRRSAIFQGHIDVSVLTGVYLRSFTPDACLATLKHVRSPPSHTYLLGFRVAPRIVPAPHRIAPRIHPDLHRATLFLYGPRIQDLRRYQSAVRRTLQA